MSTSFLAGPLTHVSTVPEPRLLLVEDDCKDLENIQVELAKHGLTRFDTATRFKELIELLGKAEYDVVSIDWELNKAERGGEILQLLVKNYPEVARVVFTQHTKRFEGVRLFFDDAKSQDFHGFLLKIGI